MDNHSGLPFNFLDRILLIIVSSFFITGFLLWLIVNFLHFNDLFIWFLTIPIAIAISYFTSKRFHFHTEEINFKPYALLFCLLAIAMIYLLQPILANPYATIGIPNKDMHDGIASYISLHAASPMGKITAENAFIPSSQSGLYLGYPNGMHVMAGFLDKLGIFEFHATWIAIILALLIASISIFLVSKVMLNNLYCSAVIAGLFAMSSFRISYAVVTSIPMLFSYTLVIPCILLCLLTIYNQKDKMAYLISALSIAFLAATYSGTVVVVGGFLAFYALLLFITRDRERLNNLGFLVLFSLPLLLFTLFFQQKIYWENTFPTAKDYDPYELSQRLPPLDQPFYMIIYVISMVASAFYFVKNKFKDVNLLKITLFVINLAFLLFIPYYLLFHNLNHIVLSSQLPHVNPNGLFGGLNYQKMSRLALLQPFFFIFFLGEFSLLIKNLKLKVLALVLIIACCFAVRLDLPLYDWAAPEIQSSFYNQAAIDKPYTQLSDVRLFMNDQIWSKDIIDGLNYLKSQEIQNNKVVVWDSRNWTEETISGWGSDYLGYKLLQRKDLNIKVDNINLDSIGKLVNNHLSYILLIDPSPSDLQTLSSINKVSRVWSEGNSYIFKLQ
jgi:hypothetical protein